MNQVGSMGGRSGAWRGGPSHASHGPDEVEPGRPRLVAVFGQSGVAGAICGCSEQRIRVRHGQRGACVCRPCRKASVSVRRAAAVSGLCAGPERGSRARSSAMALTR